MGVKRLSKRVSMSRRYNLAKKVRDHHKKIKKQARLAKKNGILVSKRQRSDPGIPNSWPLKQQELMDMETQAAAAQKARISDKDRRRMGLPALRMKVKESIIKDVSQLMQEANTRIDCFNRSMHLADVHMADHSFGGKDEAEKTRAKFYHELKAVVQEADVVVQVLDARDPDSCRNKELESQIVGSNKRLVLLLNKIDLVPKQAVEAWLARLRLEHPTLAFKACRDVSKFSREKPTSDNHDEGVLQSSATVVGANALLKLLKKYSLNSQGAVGTLTVGVIGYPNVGKSSVINSLLASANKKGKSVKTGSTAGVTTQRQAISLDKKLSILDSPGVVFAGNVDDASLVIRRSVNISAVTDPVSVVDSVLRRIPIDQAAQQFRLSDFASTDEFINMLGKAKGKFKRGGVVDREATARFALDFWSNGKGKFYVMPPAKHATEGFAQLATQSMPEFNIDDILAEADQEAVSAAHDDAQNIVGMDM